MQLSGLHILLTYGCNYECDHCFVWSSPRQSGTLTTGQIDTILAQARDAGSIEWIYFEGGEPFLHYALLRFGIRRAKALGFRVGAVSNAYWATTPDDALEWLADLAGHLDHLSVSSGLYHGDDEQAQRAVKTVRARFSRSKRRSLRGMQSMPGKAET